MFMYRFFLSAEGVMLTIATGDSVLGFLFRRLLLFTDNTCVDCKNYNFIIGETVNLFQLLIYVNVYLCKLTRYENIRQCFILWVVNYRYFIVCKTRKQ